MKDFANVPLNMGHFSSKGNQWKWRDGEFWYKADYLGYEALSEYITSKLLLKSNAPVVQYELIKGFYEKKEFTGCESKNFLLPDQELITLQKLYQIHKEESLVKRLAGMETEEKIKHVVDFVADVTGLSDFGKYLTMLLEIDALFLNEDRHMNNIAVLYNRDKGDYSYCPIFDNGAALFSDTTISFPLSMDAYECIREIKAKPFSEDFSEQVDTAEALFGIQLSVWFDVSDADALLSESSEYYGSEIRTRVYDTVREQLRRYSYLRTVQPLQNNTQ